MSIKPLRLVYILALFVVSLARADEPENPPPSVPGITSYKIEQVGPAGDPMDPVQPLPHRNSYIMNPDRTGQIKLKINVTHTYTGTVSVNLVDSNGTLMHSFTSLVNDAHAINFIQFVAPFNLVFIDPSGVVVDQRVIVPDTKLTGRDGPCFIGASASVSNTLAWPPDSGSFSSETVSGSDEDDGEDGGSTGSCGSSTDSCTSCNLTTTPQPEKQPGDNIRATSTTGADDDNGGKGSFSMAQPAGSSANGDSRTTLDAIWTPEAGLTAEMIMVHGNGDAEIERDPVTHVLQAVETASAYTTVVDEVVSGVIHKVTLKQWKTKSEASSSSPYRTTVFEQTGTRELTRTSTYSGKSIATVWRFTPAGGGAPAKWELISGSGLRREELVREDDGSLATLRKLRTRHFEKTAGGSEVLVSDFRQTFTRYSFGWKKTKLEVFDSAGGLADPLVTKWEYYDGNEPSDGGTSTNGRGLLKYFVRPDGYEASTNYSYNPGTSRYTKTKNLPPLNGSSAMAETTSTKGDGTSIVWKKQTGSATLESSELSWTSGTGGPGFNLATYNGTEGMVDTSGRVYDFGSDRGGKPQYHLPEDNRPYGETVQFTRSGSGSPTWSWELTIVHKVGKMVSGVVTDGTQTTVIVDRNGVIILRQVMDIVSGIDLEYATVSTTDGVGRPEQIDYFLDSHGDPLWSESYVYSCCGLSSFTNRDGTVTSYDYDDLGRRTSSANHGITYSTTYDGLVVRTKRSAGSYSNLEIGNSERNLVGNKQWTRSRSPQDGTLVPALTTTTYRNSAGATPNPAMLPTGIGKRVEREVPVVDSVAGHERTDYFCDGKSYQTTGNLGVNLRHVYAYESFDVTGDGDFAPLLTTRTYKLDGTTQKEESIQRVNALGRVSSSSGFGEGETKCFYTDNLLSRTVDADGVVRLFVYNEMREKIKEGLDFNRDGDIDEGSDPVSFVETKPVVVNGVSLIRTTRKICKPGEGGWVITSYDDVTPNGLEYWHRAFPETGSGLGVSHTVRTLGVDGDWTVTTYNKDDTISRSYFDNDCLVAETLWASGSTPPGSAPANIMAVATSGFVAGTAYGHDILGRRTTTTDSRTGTVTTNRDSTNPGYRDEVQSVTDAGGRTSKYSYDHFGRTTSVDCPDTPNPGGTDFTNVVNTSHYPDGSVKEVNGASYRASYTYDYANRMATMTTYGTSEAITSWTYDVNGHLEQKFYPDGNDAGSSPDPGAKYSYTAAGRPKSRTWARGLHTRYDYDKGGRLKAQRYFETEGDDDGECGGNDIKTPDIEYNFDALGRVISVLRGGEQHFTYTYDPNDLGILTETQDDEPVSPRLITHKRDGILRDVGYLFGTPLQGSEAPVPDAISEVIYSYDSAGRFSSVSYARDPSAATPPLPEVFTYGYQYEQGTGVHTAFDGSGTAKQSLLPFSLEGSAYSLTKTYEEDRNGLIAISNRTVLGVGSVHSYELNALGQRTGVEHCDPDNTLNAGIVWRYDSKGQLIVEDSSAAGGTGDDRCYAYDAMGNRTLSIAGSTSSGSGSETHYYAQGGSTSTPGANPLNQYGSIVTSAGTVNPVYDADGNLVEDANFLYEWDGENRMISVTAKDMSARNEYRYDYLSRLGGYVSYWWDSVEWSYFWGYRYVYNGWNRIESYSDSEGERNEYVWGLDLSRSQQGAGGIGGMLLWCSSIDSGENWISRYPMYDGNGNVTELVNGPDYVVAHWEYDAFGNILRVTAPTMDYAAESFEFRFSTKPQDWLTGAYYYGYRFYDPVLGNWQSRDPLEEEGGLNLSVFAENSGINNVDPLGLKTTCEAPVVAPAPEAVAPVEIVVPNEVVIPEAVRGISSLGRGVGIGAGFILSYMILEADMQRAQAQNWGIPEPYSIFTQRGFPYGEQAIRNMSAKLDFPVTDETVEEHRMLVETVIKSSRIFKKQCESEDKKTKCKFTWDSQKLGGYPPHDEYTNKLFKPDYELVVQAPDGDTARYDGGYPFPGPVKGVIEAKTGRRWSGLDQSRFSPVQRNIYNRDVAQFERQARVAKKCNLSYFIYFSEDAGAVGYQKQQPHLAPNIKYVP